MSEYMYEYIAADSIEIWFKKDFFNVVEAPPTVKVQGTCPTGWVTGSSKCYSIQTSLASPFAEAHFACERVCIFLMLHQH